jgi:hypothetical protein
MVDVTIIKLVLNTLEDIEIKGKKNIDAMLGCMNALENFIQTAEAENKKGNEVVDNG